MKKISKTLIVLATGVLALAAAAHAQLKIPIEVTCTAKDSNGQTICRELRDQIARSQRYSLAASNSSGWSVKIVTMDPFKGRSGEGAFSAASVVVLYKWEFANIYEHTCEAQNCKNAGDDIMSEVDDTIQVIFKSLVDKYDEIKP
jgi:hypothetical protein